MRRFVLILAAALLVGAAAWLAWPYLSAGLEDGAPREGPAQAVAVAVAPAPLGPVEERVGSVGTVRPAEQVDVTAEAEGVVRELLFADGQRVGQGDALARLDSQVEQAELDAAEARLAVAAAAFDRAEELRGRGAVSQASLEEAQGAVRTARADVALARTRLGKRTILAPFDGAMGFRLVSPGAYVQPGQAIGTLYATDMVEAEFRLPEQYLGRVAPGQPVAATARAYPGATFTGTLAEVGTAVDPATRQLVARAGFANADGRLRPGMLLLADVLLGTRQSVVLPPTAIVSIGPSSFVFVIRPDGTAERRAVETGRRMPGRVEVAKGLEAGERVVVDGAAKLSDGDRVEALPADSSPAAGLMELGGQVAEERDAPTVPPPRAPGG